MAGVSVSPLPSPGHHGFLLHICEAERCHNLESIQGMSAEISTHFATHFNPVLLVMQEYDLNKDGLISYREFEMVSGETVCLIELILFPSPQAMEAQQRYTK